MNTPTDNEEQRLADSAKSLFDDSVDSLDAATLSKLNQGRQAALAEVSASGTRVLWARWMPATGIAAAALVAVLMLQSPGGVDPEIPPESAASDFEILIGEDDLDMIEELEFYSWIDLADLEATDNVG